MGILRRNEKIMENILFWIIVGMGIGVTITVTITVGLLAFNASDGVIELGTGERFVRVDVEQEKVVDRQCLYEEKRFEENLDSCIYFEGIRTCQAKAIRESVWRRC